MTSKISFEESVKKIEEIDDTEKGDHSYSRDFTVFAEPRIYHLSKEEIKAGKTQKVPQLVMNSINPLSLVEMCVTTNDDIPGEVFALGLVPEFREKTVWEKRNIHAICSKARKAKLKGEDVTCKIYMDQLVSALTVQLKPIPMEDYVALSDKGLHLII